MKKILLLILLFISYNTAVSGEIIDIQSALQSCYYSFETDEYYDILEKANSQLEQDTSNIFIHYYIAIANMNLCRIQYNEDKGLAHESIINASESIDVLVSQLEQSDKFRDSLTQDAVVDIYALHSAIYGLRTGLELTNMIKYGRLAKNSIEKAYQLDSNNRKVLLIAAKHLMHTPKIFGGDKNRAHALLKKALKQKPKEVFFIDKQGNKLDYGLINWAAPAEIYAYLAQLEILWKHYDKANIYMSKSLKLEPDYGYILYDLKLQLR